MFNKEHNNLSLNNNVSSTMLSLCSWPLHQIHQCHLFLCASPTPQHLKVCVCATRTHHASGGERDARSMLGEGAPLALYPLRESQRRSVAAGLHSWPPLTLLRPKVKGNNESSPISLSCAVYSLLRCIAHCPTAGLTSQHIIIANKNRHQHHRHLCAEE